MPRIGLDALERETHGRGGNRLALTLALLVGTPCWLGCQSQLSLGVKNEVGSEALRGLRYHLGCADIVLVGTFRDANPEKVVGHAIRDQRVLRTDKLIVRDGTPGKVRDVGDNWVRIQFERGDQSRTLVFAAPMGDAYRGLAVPVFAGDARQTVVVPPEMDRYRLVAEWHGKGDKWRGQLDYNQRRYDAIEESFAACLIIDQKVTEEHVKTKRELQGLDVTQDADEPAAKPAPPPPPSPAPSSTEAEADGDPPNEPPPPPKKRPKPEPLPKPPADGERVD